MMFSQDQRRQFERDGFFVVAGFFTPTEVAVMQDGFERFKREDLLRNVSTDGDGTRTDRAGLVHHFFHVDYPPQGTTSESPPPLTGSKANRGTQEYDEDQCRRWNTFVAEFVTDHR